MAKTQQGELVPAQTRAMTAIEAAVAELQPLLDAIPETDADDDAIGRILLGIAQAETAGELDDPWDANGLQVYTDCPLRITAITKSETAFTGGFSHFLVIHATDRDGAEVITTSSSMMVMAQLLKAHALGAFPLLCVPRAAKTRKGFTAQHLEVTLG